MPLIEVRCRECGEEEERLVRSTELKPEPCVKCGKETEKQVSWTRYRFSKYNSASTKPKPR